MEGKQVFDGSTALSEIKENTWYLLKPKGKCPDPRVGHTATCLECENKVVIIGGATPHALYHELWQLDLSTWDCTSVATQNTFHPRYEHCAFIPSGSTHCVWVFGGANMDETKNDLWELDLKNLQWLQLVQDGDIPLRRTIHTTTSVLGGQMVVFGGGDRGPDPIQDQNVYRLDPKGVVWNIVETSGTPPVARQGHVLVAADNKLFCHGGISGQSVLDDLHILDEEYCWTEVTGQETRPRARAAHGSVAVHSHVYIYGGMGVDGTLSDLWQLHCGSMVWQEIVTGEGAPACLDFAISLLHLPVEEAHENEEGEPGEDASEKPSRKTPFILIHGGMDQSGKIYDQFHILKIADDV